MRECLILAMLRADPAMALARFPPVEAASRDYLGLPCGVNLGLALAVLIGSLARGGRGLALGVGAYLRGRPRRLGGAMVVMMSPLGTGRDGQPGPFPVVYAAFGRAIRRFRLSLIAFMSSATRSTLSETFRII
jgi:hypothetical protein